MRILAIDPGPNASACLGWDGEKVFNIGMFDNEEILNSTPFFGQMYDLITIEMIASYGMGVGKEVFETCVWIGRFIERCQSLACPFKLVYRLQIKTHLCHSARAKDSNIRQAIIDRFGGKDKAIGKKANPGPLWGVKSHLWAALALALFTQDLQGSGSPDSAASTLT